MWIAASAERLIGVQKCFKSEELNPGLLEEQQAILTAEPLFL